MLYTGIFFPSTLVFRFLRRKTLLQTLRADDLSLLESAPQRWNSLESPSAEDHITGKMYMTSMSVKVLSYPLHCSLSSLERKVSGLP